MIEGSKVWLTLQELSAHLSEDESKAFIALAKVRTYQAGGSSWITRPYITPTSKIQIDLESIPSQTISKYRIPAKEVFITTELEAKKSEVEWNSKQVEAARSGLFNAIAIDPETSAWYLNRMAGVQFASRKTYGTIIRDYPILASLMIKLTLLLDFTGKYTRNQKNIETAKCYGFDNVADFVQWIRDNVFMHTTISNGVKKVQARYHNFNISNERKFIERIKPFALWQESAAQGNYQQEQQLKQAALESLISSKFGKTNNCKRSDWHINQLVKLARFGNQPKSVTLCNNLNAEAKKRGMKEISYETLRLWMTDPSVHNKLRLAYEGHMKWMNNRMFVINTEGASGPDVLWFADGETVELYWYDGKALRRENYVVIMDDYSRKIIGWARGTESHDTTYRAVKHAIEHRGTVAWQFKTDKGPGFKGTTIEDFFDTVFAGGYGHTPATTGLARAKAIEPMFARFREQVLAVEFVNHSFGNITSAGPQANPDFIKEHLHEFPTNVHQLDNQWMQAVELWNNRAHQEGRHAGKSPNELYDVEYDERKYVSELWMTEKFWLSKPKPSTYEPQGLKITWAKQDYLYLAPVPVRTNTSEDDLRKVAQFLNENAGRRFDVKFDPDNLDRVALYFNGAFVCYAYNKIKTKRALFDTTSEDSHILHQYWKIQELQEADIKDFYTKNDHYAEAEGLAKAPMMLSNKKQRQDAETAMKTRTMVPDADEREEVITSKFAGLKKW
jgi:hypothetical protein